MAATADFAKLVPGFDFLESLVKNAGAAMPGIGQWVAPTINPEELEKRINELRTVQYWLEQNSRMLGATIQALEVQRMTLSTLKTMNVQMDTLRDSMMLKMPPGTPDSEPEFAKAPKVQAAPAPADEAQAAPKSEAASAPEPATPPVPGAVDPLQWWGALTKQFSELASAALKDGATAVARAPGVSGAAMSAGATEPAIKKGARRAPAKKRRPAPRAARKTG